MVVEHEVAAEEETTAEDAAGEEIEAGKEAHKEAFIDSHMRRSRYARYHHDIYIPADILTKAYLALPPAGTTLAASKFYQTLAKERSLPVELTMPETHQIVDVTVERATGKVSRVMIRAPWSRQEGNHRDIMIVLGAEHKEVITAYRIRPDIGQTNMRPEDYEQPGSEIEPTKALMVIEPPVTSSTLV